MPGYLDSNSGITFGWNDGEDDWGGPTNRSLRQLAYAGVHLTVLEADVTSPPASPTVGDKYIVGSNPTGAWASFSPGELAVYGRTEADPATLGWLNYVPRQGWRAYNADTSQMMTYGGATWTAETGGGGGTDITAILHDDSLTGGGITDNLAVNWNQQTQSDWNITSTTSPAFIKNIPASLRNYQTPAVVKPFWQKLSATFTHELSGSNLSVSQRLAQFRLNSQTANAFDLKLGAGVVLTSGGNTLASSTRYTIKTTLPDSDTELSASSSLSSSDTRVFVSSNSNVDFDVHATITATATNRVNVLFTVHGGLAIG